MVTFRFLAGKTEIALTIDMYDDHYGYRKKFRPVDSTHF